MASLEIDSTFKMVKAILRVRIRALKPYPYNNICRFTDAFSILISHRQNDICHSSDSFCNQNLHHENDIYHFSDAKKSIKSIIKSTRAILMILVRLDVHRKKRRIKDLEGPNE